MGFMTFKILGTGTMALVAAFALSSCSSSGAAENDSSQSPAATSIEVAASPTVSQISASPTNSPAAESSASSTSSETSPSTTVATEKAGNPLSLADFLEPESYWMEKRFDVADKANVSGIAVELRGYGSSDTRTLELRLANNFSNLNFKIGQANDSRSSDRVLLVRIVGNGKQLDVQKVPFNTIQEVSVPVKGVNAVKIELVLEQGTTYDSKTVLAVLSDITVE